MKIHKANIYHCISCGRVKHAEMEAKPPLCCGHTMEKAVEETLREGDVADNGANSPSEAVPPVSRRRPKPR